MYASWMEVALFIMTQINVTVFGGTLHQIVDRDVQMLLFHMCTQG